MTAITLKAEKGNRILLTYKDSAGIAIDVTGAAARMMARNSLYEAPVLTKAAVITGPTGEILFDFAPADTAGILDTQKEEKYLYDVELTLLAEDPVIILEGELTIKQVVTRD